MKLLVAVCLLVSAPICALASGYTLTFDETPPPGAFAYWLFDLYYEEYGALFSSGFQAVDHSFSTWGPPRSGTKVLACDVIGGWVPSWVEAKFGYPPRAGHPWPPFAPRGNYSVGAYFSTEPGVVVELWATDAYLQHRLSTYIGAPGESWNNRYVEINSPTGDIVVLGLRPISSPDALLHYSADDMTVVPVPEPSSLAALSFALAGVGIGVVRRRR